MTRALVAALLGVWLVALMAADATTGVVPQDPAEPRFLVVDVHADAGAARLAGWQAELSFRTATLVGVEGGGPPAFADAPRYDPAALQGGRVVLAALGSGEVLPTGRVRVARVHVMEAGGGSGELTVSGVVGVAADGTRIELELEAQADGDKR